ncbi:hypothetical protein BC832DRAFT_223365 [Gaertneriomyces semiglobifer]|nr:hypothetical protein BC832DRAFT_223365 [Gaertneriomyces semiglobifer]
MGNMQTRPPSGTYTIDQTTELTMRSAALTLMVVNLGLYWHVMTNRTSLVSRMIFGFLMSYLLGLIFQSIPRFTRDKSDISTMLTIHFGVGFFCLSNELFNWALFLRFQLITPFKPRLRTATLAILVASSAVVFSNYIAWVTYTSQKNYEGRTNCAKLNAAWSVVQAAINLYLSGYFVYTYYFPMIKSKQNSSTWDWMSGLVYLVLESLLHTALQVLYYAWKDHYPEATAICSSVRFMLFLMFIYKIREARSASIVVGDTVGSRGLKSVVSTKEVQ